MTAWGLACILLLESACTPAWVLFCKLVLEYFCIPAWGLAWTLACTPPWGQFCIPPSALAWTLAWEQSCKISWGFSWQFFYHNKKCCIEFHIWFHTFAHMLSHT